MSTILRITEAFPAPPQPETLSQQFRDAFAELIFAANDIKDAVDRRNYCDECLYEVPVHGKRCRIARLLAAVDRIQNAIPYVSHDLLFCCHVGACSQCEGSEEAVLPGGPTWRRECSCACHKEQA